MKTLYFFMIFIILSLVNATAQNGYTFFSEEDIRNIKNSSGTEWGKPIVESLKKTVEGRQAHSLRVPLLEGGHGHDYFCPVHNIMFSFDWDKPSEHWCSMCHKYWSGNNRYDWAWINSVHSYNLSYLRACMYLYIATDDKKYAEYIRDMMLDYASKYPTYFAHDTQRKPDTGWGGRMFGQSLDESVWASDACRAYSVAKPIMTKEEIIRIEKGYLSVCADLLLEKKGLGNWQVWHNSGLIALGIALQNDSIVDVALNDPVCGFYSQMERFVYNDGWWSEGSPIYHYYPLRAMLLSADAVRCRGVNLYNEKLEKMLSAPAQAIYADLFFPAHNDGWYGESLLAQVSLYEIANKRYDNPIFLEILKQCYKKVERNSAEALQNNVLINPTDKPFNLESVNFPDMGFTVLRSGEKAIVLKYGPHGGGHGHPDKLSISIHNGKKEIVPDMGTSAYGVSDFREWYRKTLSHTTLVVDFNDQKETIGELVSFKPAKNGGTLKAISNDAYPDVRMSRSLDLKGNLLKEEFSAISDKEHVYDYVIILAEKPIFDKPGEKISLKEKDAYQKISNTEIRNYEKTVFMNTANLELTIKSMLSDDFEVITGEAPGIPPRNPSILQDGYKQQPCYPVIIRTKNKDVLIKSEWKFK